MRCSRILLHWPKGFLILEFNHVPVLLEKVLEIMDLPENALTNSRVQAPCIVDGTLGLGGYAEAFLQHSQNVRVLGIDRDPRAREIAAARLKSFGDRFKVIAGNYRNMKSLCEAEGVSSVDCVVLDLGVSNMQLVDATRGFSFRENGPLDMRMDPDEHASTRFSYMSSPSAADLVNKLSREELAEIFRKYGEESFAWAIAGEIVRTRAKGTIANTEELVEIIRRTIPAPVMRKMNGHPARKVFQALRIAVNDELGALEDGLKEAFKLLSQDGQLIVITYHSLEDRIVKQQFREWSEKNLGIMEPRKGIVPNESETTRNPKSRSARLRGFHKKNMPAAAEGRLGPWRRV